MTLAAWGWREAWNERLAACPVPDGVPARVIAEHRDRFRVHLGTAERDARVAGRFHGATATRPDRPAVGDWVVVADDAPGGPVVIQAVLPRRSSFSRRAAGTRTVEQVLAANVDTAWVVSAFPADLNPARLERYVAMVWQSGASPVVVLTKSDLSSDPAAMVAELGTRIIGVPIHAVSAATGHGVDQLRPYLEPGKTIVLLGSSGVGKSTLLNHLVGADVMAIGSVRGADDKGRHTTTHRQLVPLPGGALLLDTPGMRELQLWSAEDGVSKTFEDVEALAAACRFGDCRHETEPDCAVRGAIASGELVPERLENYRKLLREQAYLRRKIDPEAKAEERRRIRDIMREYRRSAKPKS